MKKVYKYIPIVAAFVATTACNDLLTEPMGDIVTTQQKEEVYEENPEMIEAAVQAVPAAMFTMMGSYSEFGRVDTDFGYPSLMIMFDSKGMDMPSIDGNYQWYSAALSMADFGDTYYDNLITWNTWFKLIRTANALAGSIDPETENPFFMYSLAQALTYRAYAYYYLSQVYQFTYIGNEQGKTVPIITNENQDQVALEGAPLATNEEIYTQILSDINTAINLLDAAEAQGQQRVDKSYINAMVAYGIRARINLTMGNWQAAANDAQTAINKATAQGLKPYSIDQLSTPRFYTSADASYMWSVNITESFLGAAAVRSFAGMMGAFCSTGYATNGYWRRVNKVLYSQIPATDVRVNWFMTPQKTVPDALPSDVKAFAAQYDLPAYAQLKFGPPNGVVFADVAATDVPVMRVEEMYLILAEAQGRQTPSTGAATLQSFVKTYRDPSYTCNASSIDALVDAVWLQRRIELWGEGFSFYDCKRLRKTINRLGGGFIADWVFVVEPTEGCLNYNIPQTEQQGNPQVGNIPNTSQAPVPVRDID